MQSSDNNLSQICPICLDNQGKYGINDHSDTLCRECTLELIRSNSPCPICRFEHFDLHTQYNIKQRYQDILELSQDIIYEFYCQIYPVLQTNDKITFTVKDPNDLCKKPVYTLNMDAMYNSKQRQHIMIEIFYIFIIYADIQKNPRQTKLKKSNRCYFFGVISQIYASYNPLLQWEDSTFFIRDQVYELYNQIKDDITIQNTLKYKILKLHYLINYLEPDDSPIRITIPQNELNKLTDKQTFITMQINPILYENAQYYGLYMNFVNQ